MYTNYILCIGFSIEPQIRIENSTDNPTNRPHAITIVAIVMSESISNWLTAINSYDLLWKAAKIHFHIPLNEFQVKWSILFMSIWRIRFDFYYVSFNYMFHCCPVQMKDEPWHVSNCRFGFSHPIAEYSVNIYPVHSFHTFYYEHWKLRLCSKNIKHTSNIIVHCTLYNCTQNEVLDSNIVWWKFTNTIFSFRILNLRCYFSFSTFTFSVSFSAFGVVEDVLWAYNCLH